jgi:hypothetical protein
MKHKDKQSNPSPTSAVDKLSRAFYETFKNGNGVIVYDFLENQYNNTTSFVSGDSHATAYNEGCRAVFLQIKHNLDNWEKRQGKL